MHARRGESLAQALAAAVPTGTGNLTRMACVVMYWSVT